MDRAAGSSEDGNRPSGRSPAVILWSSGAGPAIMTLVPSGEKRGSPPKSLSWRTWVPLAAAVKTVTSPYLPPSRINKILPRRFVARGAEGFELSGFELSGFELSELQLPATT